MKKQEGAGQEKKVGRFEGMAEKVDSFEIATETNMVEIIRQVNGEDVKYFGRCGEEGGPLELDFQSDCLINVLHRILHPLDNLAGVIESADEDDPPPLYFLLKHLLDEADEKIATVCHEVEKKIGEIRLDITDDPYWGMKKGCILGVKITEHQT